jgi:hypothetical protein
VAISNILDRRQNSIAKNVLTGQGRVASIKGQMRTCTSDLCQQSSDVLVGFRGLIVRTVCELLTIGGKGQMCMCTSDL